MNQEEEEYQVGDTIIAAAAKRMANPEDANVEDDAPDEYRPPHDGDHGDQYYDAQDQSASAVKSSNSVRKRKLDSNEKEQQQEQQHHDATNNTVTNQLAKKLKTTLFGSWRPWKSIQGTNNGEKNNDKGNDDTDTDTSEESSRNNHDDNAAAPGGGQDKAVVVEPEISNASAQNKNGDNDNGNELTATKTAEKLSRRANKAAKTTKGSNDSSNSMPIKPMPKTKNGNRNRDNNYITIAVGSAVNDSSFRKETKGNAMASTTRTVAVGGTPVEESMDIMHQDQGNRWDTAATLAAASKSANIATLAATATTASSLSSPPLVASASGIGSNKNNGNTAIDTKPPMPTSSSYMPDRCSSSSTGGGGGDNGSGHGSGSNNNDGEELMVRDSATFERSSEIRAAARPSAVSSNNNSTNIISEDSNGMMGSNANMDKKCNDSMKREGTESGTGILARKQKSANGAVAADDNATGMATKVASGVASSSNHKDHAGGHGGGIITSPVRKDAVVVTMKKTKLDPPGKRSDVLGSNATMSSSGTKNSKTATGHAIVIATTNTEILSRSQPPIQSTASTECTIVTGDIAAASDKKSNSSSSPTLAAQCSNNNNNDDEAGGRDATTTAKAIATKKQDPPQPILHSLTGNDAEQTSTSTMTLDAASESLTMVDSVKEPLKKCQNNSPPTAMTLTSTATITASKPAAKALGVVPSDMNSPPDAALAKESQDVVVPTSRCGPDDEPDVEQQGSECVRISPEQVLTLSAVVLRQNHSKKTSSQQSISKHSFRPIGDGKPQQSNSKPSHNYIAIVTGTPPEADDQGRIYARDCIKPYPHPAKEKEPLSRVVTTFDSSMLCKQRVSSYPRNQQHFYNRVVVHKQAKRTTAMSRSSFQPTYYYAGDYDEPSQQMILIPMNVQGVLAGRCAGRPRFKCHLKQDTYDWIVANTADYKVVDAVPIMKTPRLSEEAWDICGAGAVLVDETNAKSNTPGSKYFPLPMVNMQKQIPVAAPQILTLAKSLSTKDAAEMVAKYSFLPLHCHEKNACHWKYIRLLGRPGSACRSSSDALYVHCKFCNSIFDYKEKVVIRHFVKCQLRKELYKDYIQLLSDYVRECPSPLNCIDLKILRHVANKNAGSYGHADAEIVIPWLRQQQITLQRHNTSLNSSSLSIPQKWLREHGFNFKAPVTQVDHASQRSANSKNVPNVAVHTSKLTLAIAKMKQRKLTEERMTSTAPSELAEGSTADAVPEQARAKPDVYNDLPCTVEPSPSARVHTKCGRTVRVPQTLEAYARAGDADSKPSKKTMAANTDCATSLSCLRSSKEVNHVQPRDCFKEYPILEGRALPTVSFDRDRLCKQKLKAYPKAAGHFYNKVVCCNTKADLAACNPEYHFVLDYNPETKMIVIIPLKSDGKYKLGARKHRVKYRCHLLANTSNWIVARSQNYHMIAADMIQKTPFLRDETWDILDSVT